MPDEGTNWETIWIGGVTTRLEALEKDVKRLTGLQNFVLGAAWVTGLAAGLIIQMVLHR